MGEFEPYRSKATYVIVRNMVSIREATDKAIAFARAALGLERTANLRLEEVESTTVDGQDAWLITLSMISPDDELLNIVAGISHKRREYKIFTVLKGDGEIKSMKIREMANA